MITPKKAKNKLSNGIGNIEQDDTTTPGIGGNAFFGEKSSFLLNSIPSIITYVDKDQVLRYVNHAFEKIFNMECSSEIGRAHV